MYQDPEKAATFIAQCQQAFVNVKAGTVTKVDPSGIRFARHSPTAFSITRAMRLPNDGSLTRRCMDNIVGLARTLRADREATATIRNSAAVTKTKLHDSSLVDMFQSLAASWSAPEDDRHWLNMIVTEGQQLNVYMCINLFSGSPKRNYCELEYQFRGGGQPSEFDIWQAHSLMQVFDGRIMLYADQVVRRSRLLSRRFSSQVVECILGYLYWPR